MLSYRAPTVTKNCSVRSDWEDGVAETKSSSQSGTSRPGWCEQEPWGTQRTDADGRGMWIRGVPVVRCMMTRIITRARASCPYTSDNHNCYKTLKNHQLKSINCLVTYYLATLHLTTEERRRNTHAHAMHYRICVCQVYR